VGKIFCAFFAKDLFPVLVFIPDPKGQKLGKEMQNDILKVLSVNLLEWSRYGKSQNDSEKLL
jgi:hypothetical protein